MRVSIIAAVVTVVFIQCIPIGNAAPLSGVLENDGSATGEQGATPRGSVGSNIPPGGQGESIVPMVGDGGTFAVPVTINNQLTLKFTVDSGAADVSIPADVVMTLIRTGTISDADFLGKETYRLADGSTVPSQRFVIRSLSVGDKTLENVIGSMAPVSGGLLLGQSFLSHFKSWSIDNQRQALILFSGTGDNSEYRYVTIVFGMIKSKLHKTPEHVEMATQRGAVDFYVNESGYLAGRKLFSSSGSPELDLAVMAAIAEASPYPAPPHSRPQWLTYNFGKNPKVTDTSTTAAPVPIAPSATAPTAAGRPAQ